MKIRVGNDLEAANVAVATVDGHDTSRSVIRTKCDQLIQRVANSITSTKSGDWKIERCSGAAPRLYRDGKLSNLNASMAHSGRWIAVALSSKCQIGVDIQAQDARRRFPEIAELLDMDEGARTDRREFFSSWSLREAIAKATGTSVLTPHPIELELTPACRKHGQVVASGPFAAMVDLISPDLHLAVVLNSSNEAQA